MQSSCTVLSAEYYLVTCQDEFHACSFETVEVGVQQILIIAQPILPTKVL